MKKSCVLLGDTTLAIRCGNHLLENQHDIACVVTSEPTVANWCKEQNISHVASIQELEDHLTLSDIDLLFSIVNKAIIPDSLTRQIKQFAINFHDSLLPRYAGLNASAWALLEGEKEHGISWHQIVDKVDAGDIYIQRKFDISHIESAEALNLLCYDEAYDAFVELIEHISQNTLKGSPQNLDFRTFYSSRKTPDSLGIVDWHMDAESIVNLKRGLHFGQYQVNPWFQLKCYLNGEFYLVDGIKVLNSASDATPGQILQLGDNPVIATATQDVQIQGIRYLNGETVSNIHVFETLGLKEGDVLPQLPNELRTSLKNLYRDIHKNEPTYLKVFTQLANFDTFFLPQLDVVSEQSLEQKQWHALQQHFQSRDELTSQCMSALAVYLSRLNSFTPFTFVLYEQDNTSHSLAHRSLLNFLKPVELTLTPQQRLEDVLTQANRFLEITPVGYAKDIFGRYPELRTIPRDSEANPFNVVVRIGQSIEDLDSDESYSRTGLVIDVAIKENAIRCSFSGMNGNGASATNARANANAIGLHLRNLLNQIHLNAQQSLADVDFLDASERQQLLFDFNHTDCDYPLDICLHQLFEAQAEKTPEAIAVVYQDVSDNQKLTYRELNEQANALAHYLIEQGVKPESLVALCVQRKPYMLVGLLAILKAGAAYVPLDTDYASTRLNDVLEDADPLILLTDEKGISVIGDMPSDKTVVRLDKDWDFDRGFDRDFDKALPVSNPSIPELTPTNLAYIIYTSGSTGKPKGVMIEHGNAVNLIIWTASQYSAQVFSNTLFATSLTFDLSVYECFATLHQGGTLNLVRNALEQGAVGTTHINTVPSVMDGMLDRGQVEDSVKVVNLAGEPLTQSLAESLFRETHIHKLCNLYAPSESTTYSTYYEAASAKDFIVSIGRPIANTQIYLLDEHLQPVPKGAVGEIYIAGDGVTRGYLNQPALTDERYLLNPFKHMDSRGRATRMYKTGDLARYLADGNIEYLGRNDFQVKIRGFRIELGEIENCLNEHETVHSSVVMAFGSGEQKRLVAYVMPAEFATLQKENTRQEAIQALIEHLGRHLPNYMVPSAVMLLEHWPQTPNGKLDRKALPAPDDSALIRAEYEAPQGETEQRLAQIWSSLLKVERIGRHDDFFALGGHSLLAVRLMEQLHKVGLGLATHDLFSSPTLAELAKKLGSYRKAAIPPNVIEPDCARITPQMLPLIQLQQDEIDQLVSATPSGIANIQDIYALTPLQEGILYHHIAGEGHDPYLLSEHLIFSNRDDLDAYLAAVQKVVDRHDALRTVFHWHGLSEPAQVVLRHAPLNVVEMDLSEQQAAADDDSLQYMQAQYQSLDVRQSTLLRYVIAKDPLQVSRVASRAESEASAEGRWLVLQQLHHLVGDHSTLESLAAELKLILSGQDAQLATPVPYRNLVARIQLDSHRESHQSYFANLLSDIEESTIPFAVQTSKQEGLEGKEHRVVLPDTLNTTLRAQAKMQGVSLASLCHFAFGQVVARTSGVQKAVFGTVLLGRMQSGEGIADAMGLYINTLPFRLDVDTQTVQASIKQVHRRLNALMEHEYASLAEAQRCSGIDSAAPLFTAMLNYRHNALSDIINATEEAHLFSRVQRVRFVEHTNYPFVLSVEDDGHSLGLTANTKSSIDAEHLCQMMQRALAHLSEILIHSPLVPACELDVLPPQERQKVLYEFNQSQTQYPHHLCIHQLFEQQVETTPDAVALIESQSQDCESEICDRGMTYRELNRQANQLAHLLIAKGVKPESLVALCAERRPYMLVAILAILKAGGAYVPLDPEYASSRLVDILEDANPLLLLADESGLSSIGDAAQQYNVIRLDENWQEQVLPETNPQVSDLTPSNTAYVIYTSGSTGKPKGVMAEHLGVTRLVKNNRYVDFTPGDRVGFISTVAFDAATMEIWGALANGGTAVLVDRKVLIDSEAFIGVLKSSQINILFMSVGLYNNLVNELMAIGEQFKTLLVGGDTLDADKIKRLLRANKPQSFLNVYGPTETTTYATFYPVTDKDIETTSIPIGCPIGNTQVYILNDHLQPVPVGAVGEIYIGGDGVAKGYLNRPDLTEERFLPNPFLQSDSLGRPARLYKSGDLGCHLPDGNVLFMGRNDFQVKLRGYRIELGEIEAHFTEHEEVEAATVLVLGQGDDKRLVAYVIPKSLALLTDQNLGDDTHQALINKLSEYIGTILPNYMVPSAIVLLDKWPLTPNGKLDRKALPAPDESALVKAHYEAPQGETEQLIAALWQDLLGVSQIGRFDDFFNLGGHSLLAVKLIERLRKAGLSMVIADLFDAPTLEGLAKRLENQNASATHSVEVPANLITGSSSHITPEMLPLINLNQVDVDRIIAAVPGGMANIQDIYALSPLQEGILFHHLSVEHIDPYLIHTQMVFPNRQDLDTYLKATQQIVDRHDILRTGFYWDGLSEPAQVVQRHATLNVVEVELQANSQYQAADYLDVMQAQHPRLNVQSAPLLRYVIAKEPNTDFHSDTNTNSERWLVLQQMHHLIGDHSTLESFIAEQALILSGKAEQLSAAQPFRNLIAHVRLGVSKDKHREFFTDMLRDIDEPTLPFGQGDVRQDGVQTSQHFLQLSNELNQSLREKSRALGVSLASLCHFAFGHVMARTSGVQKAVFGTVLLGRMQAGEGAAEALGLFINTLPFRQDIDEQTVSNAIKHTHKRLSQLMMHEHASLAEAQTCSSLEASAPLFGAILNYRHNAEPDIAPEEMRDHLLHRIEKIKAEERTNYPLLLSVEDNGDSLGLTAQAIEGIDPERICQMMESALEHLAELLTNAPDTPSRALDVLPPLEREQLLYGFNATDSDYPLDVCLHQLFEQQAERTPNAIALIQGTDSFSYSEINEQANQLAHLLIEKGVKPETLVALCVERRPYMLVGLLAILKAGGAYVPLDVDYASSRLVDTLDDANPLLLLTDETGLAAIGEAAQDREAIRLDLDEWFTSSLPTINPLVADLSPENMAYIIYTSGSTGKPKGVVIEHGNAVNLIIWTQTKYQAEELGMTLFATSLSFDLSVYECFATLHQGGTLNLVRNALENGVSANTHIGTTHINTVPSVLEGMLERGQVQDSVRVVNLAGEPLPVSLAQSLFKHSHIERLCNLYAPSETTTYSTYYAVESSEDFITSIGRPLANTQIYLLDEHLQPVPKGAVGEIYIAGDGVARGYLNRADLTAERFLLNPFRDTDSRGRPARMYKTGDLARYLPHDNDDGLSGENQDGFIEYLGRNDFQVKIRGFRIELGEIEARFNEQPQVQSSVVMAFGDGENKKLVAYVLPENTSLLASDPARQHLISSLLESVAEQLPSYMVPSAVVLMDAWPQTPNGKLDRKALPKPDDSAFIKAEYEAPQGEIEERLVQIWSALLHVERVGRHDNFFALGGHSLQIVKLMNLIQSELKANVSMADIFELATLSDIACKIASSKLTDAISVFEQEESYSLTHEIGATGRSAQQIVPIPRNGSLPLSFTQQRLWVLTQMDTGLSDAYHIPILWRFKGEVNVDALSASLHSLVARHEALRTVITSHNGMPEVQLLPDDTQCPVVYADLTTLSGVELNASVDELVKVNVETPFDLSKGPLIRAMIALLPNNEWLFCLTQHHMVSDAWSLGIMFKELNAFYQANLEGANFEEATSPFAALEIQYPDYAAWQRQWLTGERLQSQSDYWKKQLQHAPACISLPTDRPRPEKQSFAGGMIALSLGKELTSKLKNFSRNNGGTLFMTLLSAWSAVLARLSGQSSVVIGVPSANRDQQQIENLIGFFVNTLALHIDTASHQSVQSLVSHVKSQLLSAHANQELPFEQVVEAVNPPRNVSHPPIFQVLCNWISESDLLVDQFTLPGSTFLASELPYQVAKYDLELSLQEKDGNVEGMLAYATALYDEQTIIRFRDYFYAMLKGIVADSESLHSRINLLASEERQHLLYELNNTKADYPRHLCLHQLFEQQAEKTPDAIAVKYRDPQGDVIQLTYQALNASANQLAHVLVRKGVKPETLVALCVERHPYMLVGLLAILKAGGAYVPLDPDYASERLVDTLDDAQPLLLLTDEFGLSAINKGSHKGSNKQAPSPVSPNSVIRLDSDWQTDYAKNAPLPVSSPVVDELKPENMAYVIYTSGSTGKPKGVVIEHGNAVNLIAWTANTYQAEELATTLFATSLSFDLSVYECFSTLYQGGTLNLVRNALEQGVAGTTHINTVPSVMAGILERNGAETGVESTVKVINLAGEPLPASLAKRIFQQSHIQRLCNLYAPSETTTYSTYYSVASAEDFITSIGRPLANTQIYLLDEHLQPVPKGVVGEIYIAGDGVARGYLNRPDMTDERFLPDPFNATDSRGRPARMYKTGDLGRYLLDKRSYGNIEYLGRNDFQVKIRGFRIELGEIESRLNEHHQVQSSTVMAFGEGEQKRLVGYVIPEDKTLLEQQALDQKSIDQKNINQKELVQQLLDHVAQKLPSYMVPSAIMLLEQWPQTSNGKLDRKALPVPDDSAYVKAEYAEPEGETEMYLAGIWSEILKLEAIGRHDDFFALGGHSLLAVRLMDRVGSSGTRMSIKDLFDSPTLAQLAQRLEQLRVQKEGDSHSFIIPENLITSETRLISPDMLPLIDLSQSDIDSIVASVPGGMANIQDIYGLSPLQEGILFHHISEQGRDPYLLNLYMTFENREALDAYLAAIQKVIERHDILRTTFRWEGLNEAAQVVLRHASAWVQEVTLDSFEDKNEKDKNAIDYLQAMQEQHSRIDIRHAPLFRFLIAQEPGSERWLVLHQHHHLIGDHSALEQLNHELHAILLDNGTQLAEPQPFRNLIAVARLATKKEAHQSFFSDMLHDVEEPSLPFGLSDVQMDGLQSHEHHLMLPESLHQSLRDRAKSLGVSLASLCHFAFGHVVARTSGTQKAVFGTVLLGRMLGRMLASQNAADAMGLFINTLPFRQDVNEQDIQSAIKQTHQRLSQLMMHEHASLAQAQRCSSVDVASPLFSAILNYRHNVLADSHKNEHDNHVWNQIEWLKADEKTNYPLLLSVEDFGHKLGLTVQCVESVDAERVCLMMTRALEHLSEMLSSDPTMPARYLDVLPASERQQLLYDFNATDSDYPLDVCLHQLFEAQAKKTPDAVAVVHEIKSSEPETKPETKPEAKPETKIETLTYQQLNHQANQLAYTLIAKGVKPETLVALCVERRPYMLVGLLAILKAGGAYVPLDADYASSRLADTLQDAKPLLLLTDETGLAAIGDAAQAYVQADTLIRLDDPGKAVTSEQVANPNVEGLTPENLAYIIYTSGSTGKPKGVMIEHGNAVNLIAWTRSEYRAQELGNTLFATSLSFDLSVYECFATLHQGGTLNLVRNALENGVSGNTHINNTHINTVPSVMEGMLERGQVQDTVQVVNLAGEPLPSSLAQSLFRKTQVKRLCNLYAPSESTTYSTYYAVESSEDFVTTIGRPLANTQIYLLDEDLQPVPKGIVGEIYIAGDGIARGYLNQPDLTNERFLPNPFREKDSRGRPARMYKTGDLARYLSGENQDGFIEYLGRNDFQVKIRGFRIELGEIEARLNKHEQVQSSVVTAFGKGDQKRLVAYVLANDTGIAEQSHDPSLIKELIEHLSAQLPSYMVPSAVMFMDSWPQTPNGKLDRKALPVPDDSALIKEEYEAPQGETEQQLAAIWSELLQVENVGRHDDFFTLGGHSLLAVKLMDKLSRVGLGISIKDLFDSPTLAGLSKKLGSYQSIEVPDNVISVSTTHITPDMLPLINLNQADIDRITRSVAGGLGNIQDIYGLSPLQEGILYHYLSSTETDPYLLNVQMVFANKEDLDTYLAAVQQVIDRHDILRTAFCWEGLNEPAQVVLRQVSLSVINMDLDASTSKEGYKAQLQQMQNQHGRLDIRHAPLLRLVIAKAPTDTTKGDSDSDKWLVLHQMHHLIGDHSTLEHMMREITLILEGRAEQLTTPQPFRNLVAQVRMGSDKKEHQAFFTSMLADIEEPTLPFGLGDVQQDGSQSREHHIKLPAALNDKLRQQAKTLGVSLASLCHFAYGHVVSRASGVQQAVFGTVLLGRMQAGEGTADTMGLFINTLPFRQDVNEASLESGIKQTHRQLSQLMIHEYASLSEAQRCSGMESSEPLFSALLNYRYNTLPDPSDVESAKTATLLDRIEWIKGQERTNYPFVLSIEEYGDALGLTAQVVDSIAPERVCNMMARALEHLSELLAQAPDTPSYVLDVLPPQEREALLYGLNQTHADYPREQCIHELFEYHANANPDAIAVLQVNDDGYQTSLNYREVNEQANQLAHLLIERGVEPNTLVAICSRRRPYMLVAMLAVLKAGGAYVPLDPAYASSRLLDTLEDANPLLLLADEAGLEAIGYLDSNVDSNIETSVESELVHSLIRLDRLALDSLPAINPQIAGLDPNHLAYVIYTSGSTGKPKGVMLEHGGLMNLASSQTRLYGVNASTRVMQFASPGFDASVFDLAMMCVSGGSLFLRDELSGQDARHLFEQIAQQGVTHVLLPPVLFRSLSLQDISLDFLESLEVLILGGEASEPQLVNHLSQQTQVFNAYGPTEGTVVATVWASDGQALTDSPPIGRPIDNTQIYLLDEHLQPVPKGAVGEMWIGGDGVARGYLNREDLTQERFVTDPFREQDSRGRAARIYRTGDLARYLPDGNLMYLGRNDFQVKLRGYRIELGEIESQLASHELVQSATVLAVGEAEQKRLVGWVIPEDVSVLEDENLRQHFIQTLHEYLMQHLPDYMVPSALVLLDSWPQTPNGKLDRKALPQPDEGALIKAAYEAPQGVMEEQLAQIWSELLGVEQVGRHDNFFSLGGHSLHMVKLINLIQSRLNVSLSMVSLTEQGSLQALAETCDQQVKMNSLKTESETNTTNRVKFTI
ncbi:amino acid adenylation domain-containing protein [Paraneptunicella aestuarii]|uniref:non-ribosomal peptide synthetase n=1 Tax=Paraneptunicella aestuarii TaxID=2831148 RepID=UPI001E31F09A|nr:non-ribosomal peptide synthetase [Paraneptunicella aestuarii]UAA37183.1 amino acid adenylation domain-containing protein [Paraneptunicella aestuarii]